MRGAWWALLVFLFILSPSAVAFGWPGGAYNPYAPFVSNDVHVFVSKTNAGEFEAVISEGFLFWEDGGNERLQWRPMFIHHATEVGTNIVISFRNEKTIGCGFSHSGVGCGAFGAPDRAGFAVIATQTDGGNPVEPSGVLSVFKHELGHALGVGHSPEPADLMYGTDAEPATPLDPLLALVPLLLPVVFVIMAALWFVWGRHRY
jgi:hypothetical protein